MEATDERVPAKVGRRWVWISPDGYLRFHLAIGFVIALVCSVAFAALADEIFETKDVLRADREAQQYAAAVIGPGHTIVVMVVTAFGSPQALVSLSLVVIAWLLHQRSRRRLFAFVAIMAGGALMDQLLKLWFHRARPDDPLVLAHGYSFPSGHSMGSLTFFWSLAYVYAFSLKRHPIVRVGMIVTCLLAPIVIGASRIYLGVHYFTDVVGGFVAGLAWMGVCFSGVEMWVSFRDRRRTPRTAS